MGIESKTIGAVTFLTSSAKGVLMMTPAEEIKKSKPLIQEVEKDGKLAPWGVNNLFPQEVVSMIEKSDLACSVLEKKCGIIYADGLRYGTLAMNEKGEETFTPLKVPEIDDWLQHTAINFYLADALSDHFTFYNVFARFRLTLNGQKIGRLEVSDACHSRLGVQNANGEIDKAYLNANFDQGRNSEDKDTIVVDALNPYFGTVLQMQELAKKGKGDFIMPVRAQKRGRIYYELMPWFGLLGIGWLDVAFFVPQLKKYLMKNKMRINLVIKVDSEYWNIKFGKKEWAAMTTETKIEKQKKFLDEVIATSQGTEKAGNAFLIPQEFDQVSGKYREYITIESFETAKDSGEYIEDSQEADYHIARALGLPPTLAGITPGKGNNSGSGSDQRVAHNNFILDSKMDMDRVLSPLDVVSEFNGWNTAYAGEGKLVWRFQSYYVATLNSGSQVQSKLEKAHGDS